MVAQVSDLLLVCRQNQRMCHWNKLSLYFLYKTYEMFSVLRLLKLSFMNNHVETEDPNMTRKTESGDKDYLQVEAAGKTAGCCEGETGSRKVRTSVTLFLCDISCVIVHQWLLWCHCSVSRVMNQLFVINQSWFPQLSCLVFSTQKNKSAMSAAKIRLHHSLRCPASDFWQRQQLRRTSCCTHQRLHGK